MAQTPRRGSCGAAPPRWAAAVVLLLAVSVWQQCARAASGAPPGQGRWRQGSPTNPLEQHLQHSSELDWAKPADGKCPKWVTDYVAWHRRTRNTFEAKYLVHTCHKAWDCHHGLGDRMRGLYPALQLAIAHKRVLLIDWSDPAPLDHFLVPAQINWSVKGLGLDMEQAAEVPCCDRAHFWSNAPKAPQDRASKVWKTSTNSMFFNSGLDPQMPREVPQFHRVSWATHCLMTALFEPSPALIKATNAEQLRLLGSLDKPFVAVHLRMGHLEGEAQDIDRGWDHFQGLLAAYQCAWRRNHLLHAPRAPPPAKSPAKTPAKAPARAPPKGKPAQAKAPAAKAPVAKASVARRPSTSTQRHHSHHHSHHHHAAALKRHLLMHSAADADAWPPLQQVRHLSGPQQLTEWRTDGPAPDAAVAEQEEEDWEQLEVDAWEVFKMALRGPGQAALPGQRDGEDEATGSGSRTQQHQVERRALQEGPVAISANGTRHHHPHRHNILMLTDHNSLRTAVAHGMLAGVAGPNYLAYHISYYKERSKAQKSFTPQDHELVSMSVYVDLVLLARAHCVVWAPSGFPMVAMTLGFNPCTVDVPTCIDEAKSATQVYASRHRQ